jgi:endonuclease/exonuclease/phosphatase family metal-dependent hydrolase
MIVRILSYNVYGMPWGSKDIHEILMWIFCQSGADIVCLQEVFSKKYRAIIREKTAAAHWIALFPDDPCFAGKLLSSYTSGSGLCILVKPSVKLLDVLPFERYRACDAWIEKVVSKGFFGIRFRVGSKAYIVYNTHMVSDITECKPIRISHFHSRRFQEKQLLEAARRQDEPVLIVGDFNQEEFHYFHRPYTHEGWTYRTTEEQIDHVACLPEATYQFSVQDVKFHQDIPYSDHIPLLVSLEL